MTTQDMYSMFSPIFMQLLPYFVCALLGVDSMRVGLAEDNRLSGTYFFDIVITRKWPSKLCKVLFTTYVCSFYPMFRVCCLG